MDPRTEKMLAERAERNAAPPAPRRGPLTSIKLLAGAGLAVVFAVYYLTVALPAQRADQLQMEARAAERLKAATSSRQVSVADCLTKAQADAEAQWTAACKARKQGANCPLPEAQGEDLDRAGSAARNACLLGR